MKPTAELFEAYLKCPAKCWLLSQGAIGEGNAYADWVKAQNEAFHAVALLRLQEIVPENERVTAPPRGANLKAAWWRLAVDMEVSADNAVSRLRRFGRARGCRRAMTGQLSSFQTAQHPGTNFTRDDRPLGSVRRGEILSEVLGSDVDLGTLNGGNDHGTLSGSHRWPAGRRSEINGEAG